MALVRVRPDVRAAVIWNGLPRALTPDLALERDDPFVQAFPWAFDLGDEAPVEQATAMPGEKRSTRRPRKTDADA